MKLLQSFLPIIPLALLLFSVSAFGEEKTTVQSPLQSFAKETEWINSDYIKTLKATKSPTKAAKNIYIVCIEISKKNQKTEWTNILNTNNGNIAINYQAKKFIKIKDNVFLPLFEKEPDDKFLNSKEDSLTFIGKPVTKIQWTFKSKYYRNGELNVFSFDKADTDINNFVNRYSLAGKYKNKNGQDYTFTENGNAKWPNRSFKYQSGLGYAMISKDFFYINHNPNQTDWGELYVYEWEHDRLNIFNARFNPKTFDIDRDNKPFLILTPVK